jgi:hypothetical protein
MFQFLVEAVLHIINLSFVGAWTLKTMLWHQWPPSIMYHILSLTNLTLLNAELVLLRTKNLHLILNHSPFHRKMCILLLVQCHHNMLIFYGEWLLATWRTPHPEAGGSPLVGCPRLLFKLFEVTFHSWRPFRPSTKRAYDTVLSWNPEWKIFIFTEGRG